MCRNWNCITFFLDLSYITGQDVKEEGERKKGRRTWNLCLVDPVLIPPDQLVSAVGVTKGDSSRGMISQVLIIRGRAARHLTFGRIN